MQLHYPTVSPTEQQESIGKVISLMQVRAERASGAPTTPGGAPKSEPKAVLNEAQNTLQEAASGAPSGAPLR